jgi:hypothetical protein
VRSVELKDERLQLQTSFAVLDLPIESMRGIVFKPSAMTDAVRQNLDQPSNQFDTVWAESENGLQSAEGLIQSIAEGKLTGEFAGQERTVSVNRIVAVVAADLGLDDAEDLVNCQLDDGSLVRASIERLSDGQIEFRFAGGGQLLAPWENVVQVSLESDRLAWLSDLSPILNEHEPIVTHPQPAQVDASVSGNPLTLRSAIQRVPITYSKGLGVHAYSRLVYRNDSGFDRLAAVVGIDAETQGQGDCVFVVSGDGVVLWSQRVRASDEPLPIDIDISNVQELSLVVEPGQQLDLADHADWCDARLLKTK